MFSKVVDKRNRGDMVSFLKDHFRYYTMNSWNLSTSCANCIKLHHLDIPPELRQRASEMIEVDSVWDSLNEMMYDWGWDRHFAYQVSSNGRSGGYLVLIRGGVHDDGNYFTRPGLPIDQDEDYDWDMEMLRVRVQLVQEFDRLCDDMFEVFLGYCKQYRVVDKIIQVPTTIRALEEL